MNHRIDRLCDARDWALLVELRDRCRKAVDRGKQLWPAANHVEYRLALEAPGRAQRWQLREERRRGDDRLAVFTPVGA